MPVVRQHVLNVFSKRATGDLHGSGRQIVEALPSCPNTRNAANPGHMEFKLARTWPQVTINITATKGSIGFTNDLLERM